MNTLRTSLAVATLLLGVSVARADYEADLLKKFTKDNSAAVLKVKQEVETCLSQAALLRTADPEQAHQLLRKGLDLLQTDTQLPREDRALLLRRLHVEFTGITETLAARSFEEKEKARALRERATAVTHPFDRKPLEPPGDSSRKPPFFVPIVTPAPSSASFQVTPVVLPDRRYVRIGVGGSFVFPRVNWVPVPVLTPTVLHGPGTGVTVTGPVALKYVLAPVPSFTAGFINTTVIAPDGGTVLLGGYTSSFNSRAEFGTPILGRVPYLSPLFRGTSFGASTSSFRIGVSARVISLDD